MELLTNQVFKHMIQDLSDYLFFFFFFLVHRINKDFTKTVRMLRITLKIINSRYLQTVKYTEIFFLDSHLQLKQAKPVSRSNSRTSNLGSSSLPTNNTSFSSSMFDFGSDHYTSVKIMEDSRQHSKR